MVHPRKVVAAHRLRAEAQAAAPKPKTRKPRNPKAPAKEKRS